MLQYKTTRKFTEQIPLTILTGFLTHDLEYTIALNNGVGESSAGLRDTSVQKTVERENVKHKTQYNTTILSHPRENTAAGMRHVKKLWRQVDSDTDINMH